MTLRWIILVILVPLSYQFSHEFVSNSPKCRNIKNQQHSTDLRLRRRTNLWATDSATDSITDNAINSATKASSNTDSLTEVDVTPSPTADDKKGQVLRELSKVIDPDLGSDIVTLGFVKELDVTDEGGVSFQVQLTTPACPVKEKVGGAKRRLRIENLLRTFFGRPINN